MANGHFHLAMNNARIHSARNILSAVGDVRAANVKEKRSRTIAA